MKILFCFAAAAAIATGSLPAQGTPVWFPLIGISGSANNRDITLIPDVPTAPLIYGNYLVALQTLLIHPIRGNATNLIIPWGYTLRVDGWAESAHIVVPNTTNLVNVVSLITNAVALGFPVVNYLAATNIDNASGTNVNLSGNITIPYSSSRILFNGNNGLSAIYQAVAGDLVLDGTGVPGGTAVVVSNYDFSVPGGAVSADSVAATWLTGNVKYPNGFTALGVGSGGDTIFYPGTSGTLTDSYGYLSYQNQTIMADPVGNLFANTYTGNGSNLTCLTASQMIGKFSVTNSPGITTNLQFTFSNTRTNTLYFTNGILMRVTQP